MPTTPSCTYVLVHGSWHGSWCWERVVPGLQAAGHRAVTVDLAGRAGDPTPTREITLASHVDRVCAAVLAQPTPVVLVGHSMGGMVVTQATEQCAEHIATLVYLCGFMLQDGESLAGLFATLDNGLTASHMVTDEAAGTVFFTADAPLREIFYHDCSEADFERARNRLVPEIIAPRHTPLRTTPERFGSVPRVYIETLQDHSIPIALQRRMIAAQPPRQVLTMDTSHSPFYAQPEALLAHLCALAPAE